MAPEFRGRGLPEACKLPRAARESDDCRRNAGVTLHGEQVRAALTDLAEPVDIVNVFRRLAFVPEVEEAAIAIRAPVVWMQPGVRHDGAKGRAESAGLSVVADRCISVEHRRRLPRV